MPGRPVDPDDPYGLNAGFPALDPKWADWEPPADRVPMPGTIKDPRLHPELRRRRGRNGRAVSDVSSPEKPSGAPKLDGTGSWAAWGVKEPVEEPRRAEQRSNGQSSSKVSLTEATKLVRDLTERIRARDAATAKPTVANSGATTGAGSHGDKPANLPPHLRLQKTPRLAEPDTNLALPTNGQSGESRRTSDATLVNPVVKSANKDEDEDEKMAMRLQLEEYGVDSVAQATMITNPFKAPGLYKKLHLVHEVLWKQQTLKLPAFNASMDQLFAMSDIDFELYRSDVHGMFLSQWNSRHARLEEIVEKQTKVEPKQRYSVQELMEMDGRALSNVFEKVSMKHKDECGASDAKLGQPEADGYAFEFDSDGYGFSDPDSTEDEDEDEDEDDEDGPVVFKGRGI